MERFRINNTDLTVTTIGHGSTTIGTSVDRKTSFDLLDRWLDFGGNLIDTAHIYGANHAYECSKSEETIGDWLKERGTRDRIVLCTKGGHPEMDPEKGFGKPRLHADELENDLTMSLRSLKTDCIDIYLLHRDDPAIPVSDIVDWLEKKVSEGKIRYYGCSNWTLSRIKEAQAYAEQQSCHGFIANQIAGGLARLDDQAMKYTDMRSLTPEYLDYHRKTGMAVMSYMSMNNGYFQKRISGTPLPPYAGYMYSNETNEILLGKLREMAQAGISLTAVMYQYIMHYGVPVTALFGFSKVSQLEELIKASELPVPESDLEELRKIRWGALG